MHAMHVFWKLIFLIQITAVNGCITIFISVEKNKFHGKIQAYYFEFKKKLSIFWSDGYGREKLSELHGFGMSDLVRFFDV